MALGTRTAGELLGEVGLEFEVDEAGNAWAYLEGEDASAAGPRARLPPRLRPERRLARRPARGDGGPRGRPRVGRVGLASPRGPWRWSTGRTRRARSAAACSGAAPWPGSLDPAELEGATGPGGRPLAEALAENGVELARMAEAGSRLERIGDYIELHIEQGPVLGRARRVRSGGDGLRRTGAVRAALHRAGLARRHDADGARGTTPGWPRRQSHCGVEEIATAAGGVGTSGVMELRARGDHGDPGRRGGVSIDIRHPEAGPLSAMLEAVVDAAQREARGAGASSSRSRSGGSSRSPSTRSWWTSREACVAEAAGEDRSGWRAARCTTRPRWREGSPSR